MHGETVKVVRTICRYSGKAFRCVSNSSTRVENPEARSSLERHTRRWEDNIKLDNPEAR